MTVVATTTEDRESVQARWRREDESAANTQKIEQIEEQEIRQFWDAEASEQERTQQREQKQIDQQLREKQGIQAEFARLDREWLDSLPAGERLYQEAVRTREKAVRSLEAQYPNYPPGHWDATVPAVERPAPFNAAEHERAMVAAADALVGKIREADSRRLWDSDFRREWDQAHPGGMDHCRCSGHRLSRREVEVGAA